MLKKIVLPLLFTIIASSLFAQTIDNYFESQQTVLFQKLYLHTDREFYFLGDTLWFAAYLVEGQTHFPLQDSCNLYLNLINSNGDIEKSEIFLIENGFCPGWLALSDTSLNEGNYIIRAYTDYLKNFGNDAFFTKTIRFSYVKNSMETTTELPKKDSNKIDVSFLPEGGFLLTDQVNLLAFKAIDESGYEIEIEGKLLDSSDEVITVLNSKYKGMGSFYFMPEENEEYKIEIDEFPDLDIKFPEIRTEGAKLAIKKVVDEFLSLNIITNDDDWEEEYYVAVFSRGNPLFFLEVSGFDISNTILIKTELLEDGINRIILLNENFEPLSERLYFHNKNKSDSINFSFNKQEFSTRDKVSVRINNTSVFAGDENAQLSMVVINETALNNTGINQNIKSYLLLDSELNGPVSSPADYFVDEDKLSSATKLEFLMLTNGWRNYVWNSLKSEKVPLNFEPKCGFEITGEILNWNERKTLENAGVSLGVSSGGFSQLYFSETDIDGKFSFKNVLLNDTALVFAQGKTVKNKLHTNVVIDSLHIGHPVVSNQSLNKLRHFTDIPILLYRLHYYNDFILKEFYPDRDTRMIEQVDVIAKEPEWDGHFRIYGSPDYSLQLDETDRVYANIFQYLVGRVPGVKVMGTKVRIRVPMSIKYIGISTGSARTVLLGGEWVTEETLANKSRDVPLYLLNGAWIDEKSLSMISVGDIDKIEILKGVNVSVMGRLGSGGVISVFTKRDYYDTDTKEIPGTVFEKIKGFSSFREFYLPKYTPENIDLEKPDFRTTLYWNPSITSENGKAEVTFYTSDDIASYKVFVEGIISEGRICLGESMFEVMPQE
ncbi:MAG: hypothetical protein HQ541_04335 [Mariniphaga sp.]|nr:hypothetical protein [Mariniphaga sp.]